MPLRFPEVQVPDSVKCATVELRCTPPKSGLRESATSARKVLTRTRSTMPPIRLLLVWHSRTGLARSMADALEHGALAAASEMEAATFTIEKKRACDATLDDLLQASGYLFCAPENLASTSGEMLEFFHRTYYHAFSSDALGETSRLLGKPYGIAIAAGNDGRAAAQQVERICRGWRLRPVAEPYIHRNGQPQTKGQILQPKRCPTEASERCAELGGLVAATILL